jgi:hypothetical protein
MPVMSERQATDKPRACCAADDPKEEALSLKLLIDLHKGRASMFDRVCEMYHEVSSRTHVPAHAHHGIVSVSWQPDAPLW